MFHSLLLDRLHIHASLLLYGIGYILQLANCISRYQASAGSSYSQNISKCKLCIVDINLWCGIIQNFILLEKEN